MTAKSSRSYQDNLCNTSRVDNRDHHAATATGFQIFAMDDNSETDPREVEAATYDLNYIGLDGSIGCLGEYFPEHRLIQYKAAATRLNG